MLKGLRHADKDIWFHQKNLDQVVQSIVSQTSLLVVKCLTILVSTISNYTPDIRSMWKYIVFAFPFVCSSVCSFIRSFVHSFIFPSQGQSFCVKVYKTSYFEDPLMDFVYIWHDGRYRSKVFISTIPTPGVTLGSRSRT